MPIVVTLTIWQIHHSLARTVVKSPRFSHITPVLKFLHWLKVKDRIEYQLLSLTYKVLTTSQPTYLSKLVTVQSPCSTRSSSVVTISRPPVSSSLKLQTVHFNIKHPTFGINSLFFSVSLIHILVFYLLTILHTSDPHCHHNHFYHQSLLLFCMLDSKHTSSSSLFRHRLLHRYSPD